MIRSTLTRAFTEYFANNELNDEHVKVFVANLLPAQELLQLEAFQSLACSDGMFMQGNAVILLNLFKSKIYLFKYLQNLFLNVRRECDREDVDDVQSMFVACSLMEVFRKCPGYRIHTWPCLYKPSTAKYPLPPKVADFAKIISCVI